MSVIQISRVQHRRGTSGELPDSLADGEIGMTTDTGEVFIGAPNNPKVQGRHSYPYQNIKILTELDVQYGVRGDVYYHGALESALSPANGQWVSLVGLFPTNLSRDFAVLDFSLSNSAGTVKVLGEISACIASDADLSTVNATVKTSVGWSGDLSDAFKLTKVDNEGTSTSGITWLAMKNTSGIQLTLCVSGRIWTTPSVS